MIRKRGDKWTVLVYDPITKGKRWVGTYDSKRDANKAEAEAKLQRKRSRDETETCDSFAERWMRDYPRQRESTNISYEERISKFGKDFRGIPLDSVTRPMARRWAIDNPGRFRTVRAMFSDAVRDGLAGVGGMTRAQFVNFLASAVIAVFAAGIVAAADGPTWAWLGFGIAIYLNEVKAFYGRQP